MNLFKRKKKTELDPISDSKNDSYRIDGWALWHAIKTLNNHECPNNDKKTIYAGDVFIYTCFCANNIWNATSAFIDISYDRECVYCCCITYNDADNFIKFEMIKDQWGNKICDYLYKDIKLIIEKAEQINAEKQKTQKERFLELKTTIENKIDAQASEENNGIS